MAKNVTIHIHVLDTPLNDKKVGSFESPEPLVRVDPGTEVKWERVGADKTFVVEFFDGSPFDRTLIDQDTGVLVANNPNNDPTPRNYHYSVTANAAGKTWKIHKCPEIEVGTP